MERLDRLGRSDLPIRLDLVDDLLYGSLAKLRRRRHARCLLLHLRSAHLRAAGTSGARHPKMRLGYGGDTAHSGSGRTDLALRRRRVRTHRRVHHRRRAVHAVHTSVRQLAH